MYTYFIISESTYVEKGVGGRGEGVEANDIWKYQMKWNHFHHMGP